MSKKVDERVVEMRFDNRQFESNVSTSMSTLEKLKKSLKLDKAAKGFDDINKSAKNVNLSGLGKAVESVQLKFSALQVAATTALANITNSAVNAGKRLIDAFTLEPIMSGFNEYETQINAVQTILANTQSKGSTLDDVNAALDELNTYADKTIYNFTEMTRNIGTFTAAGVDLDKSVTSIKGIANLAAVSGSSAQQASTAMYQLSQAIAAGKVQLMDWNSVVNAGMGGELFQNALKRTAEHFGYNVDAMIEKYGSFRESLTRGGWLTTEVLTETLTQLSGAYSEADLIAQGYSESQAREITELAQTAVDAATKVKTFTQLMDTLKEAVQSGWTQTWEIIIGDFEEAKELFTGISDFLGNIINESSQRRNDLLEGALGDSDSKWESLTQKINECGISTLQFEQRLRETAIASGMTGEAFDEIIQREGSLANAFKNGELSIGLIKDTIKSFVDTMTGASEATEVATDKLEYFNDVVKKVINGDFGNGADRIKALTEAGYDNVVVQELVNKVWERNGENWSDTTITAEELTDVINNLSSEELVNIGYTQEQADALKELAKQAEETGTPINELIESLNRPSGRELLVDSFKNIFKSIYDGIQAIRNAWKDIFPPMTSEQLYNIIEGFHGITESLILTEDGANKLQRTFRGLFALLDIVASIAGSGVRLAFKGLSAVLTAFDTDILSVTAAAGDALVKFRDWFDQTDIVANGLRKAAEGARWLFEELLKLPQVQSGISRIQSIFWNFINGAKDLSSNAGEYIQDVIEKLRSLDTITLSDILNILGSFKEKALDSLKSVGNAFSILGEKLSTVADFIKSKFSGIGLGEILTILFGVSLFAAVRSISKALEELKSPLDAFVDLIDGATGVLHGFSGVLKAYSTNLKAEAIQKIAISIGILAASIVILTQLDQKKVWSSVGALTVLGGGLLAFSSVLGKVGNVEKGSFKITGIAVSILLLVKSLDMLEDLNREKLGSSLVTIGILAAELVAAVGILSKIAPKLSSGFGALISMSVSLMIFVSALSKLNSMDIKPGSIGVLTLIVGEIAGLMLAAKLAGKSAGQAGKSMLGISIALLVITTSLSRLNNIEISSDTIEKLTVIMGSVAGLMAATRLAGNNASKAGAGLLGLSVSLLLIITVLKQADNVDVNSSNIGALAVAVGVLAGLMTATRLAGKDALKAGASALLMSVAVGLLVGVMALLSLIDPSGLERAEKAVVILGGVLAGIIASTKLAQDCKATLITLTVTLGVLAVAIGTLSMIDPKGLQSATIALSTVMGMFSLMIASTKLAQKATGSIALMLAVVAGIAAILGAMTYLDVEPSIETAASISLLLLSMTAALTVLSTFGAGSGLATTALAALGAVTLIVAGLAVILGVMAHLDVEPSIETAASLSLLLLSMTASLTILSTFGAGAGLATAALGAMAILGLIVAEIAAVLGIMAYLDVEPSIETAASLSLLLLSMSSALVILSAVGATGPAAFVGIGALMTLVTAMGGLMVAIGALMEYVPGMQQWLDNGMAVLEQVANGIGSIFGNIVGGFMEGATSTLPEIGNKLSAFITNLQPFLDGISGLNADSISGFKDLVGAIASLTTSNLLGSITSFFTGDSSFESFGSQLKAFASGIKAYCNEVNGIETNGVEASITAGKAIIDMANSIPNSGGVAGFFAGNNDVDTFGSQLKAFGKGIKEYCNEVSGIDSSGIEASITAGKAIIEMANSIPNSGGAAGFFAGENDIDTFGSQLKSFAKGIKEYCSEVSGIETSGVEASVQAASSIIEMANSIPNSGGVAGFFAGDNDLSAFGSQLVSFGKAIKNYCSEVSQINADGVQSSMDVINALSSSSLNSIDSSQIESVGDSLKKFGGQLKDFAESVGNIDTNSSINIRNAVNSIATSVRGLSEINLEGFISSFEGASSRVSSAATNMVTSVTNAMTGMNSALSAAGNSSIASFVQGMMQASSAATAAAVSIVQTTSGTMLGQSSVFLVTGNSLIASFVQGMMQASSAAISAGSSVAQGGASGAKSQRSAFVSAGSYIVAGLAEGIRNGQSSVVSAATSVATAAITAANDALGIASPSRAFIAIGRYIGEGLAQGIRDSAYMAVNATTDMAQQIQNAASMAFEDIESWVSDAKAFDELSLEDELVLWDTVAQKYEEGTEERTKAEKNAYSAYKELLNERFQNSKDWIDREKEYNRLSLEEELAAWQRVQADYIEGTDEREEADKQVYKLRHELIDEDIDLLKQEIERQEELLSGLQEGSIEYANTVKEINNLQNLLGEAEYQNSERWIQEQKDFDLFTRGMTSELAAYIRELKNAQNGKYGIVDEEALYDFKKKVYDQTKEIYERYEQYEEDRGKLEEDANEQRLELRQEYYDKEKEINDKLREDIDELNDDYNEQLKSRTDALYDAYDLFDEVEKKEEVSASDLMKNLQDQVNEFDEWRDAMDQLSARGLNEDLIDELQEMGPSAVAEIKALNTMSDSQLAQYATLWATRHQEAANRAEEELEGIRESTDQQIKDLEAKAKEDLDEYIITWNEKMAELDASVNQELDDLRNDFYKEVGLIETNTEVQMTEMVNAVQRIMREAGWDETGQYCGSMSMRGFIDGIMAEAESYYDALTGTQITGQGLVEHVNKINSPSKVYAEIGKNIIMGLVVGVNDTEDQFYNSLDAVSKTSIDSMSDTISRISDVIGGDMDFEPSIRPVVDLSNVESSIGYMDGVISARRSMVLGMSISRQNQNREYSLVDRLVSDLSDANVSSNREIVDAIVGLKSDFDSLASRIEKLQVVMDTGSLVGAISPQMDKSLGRMAAMNRRRSK